MDEQRNAALYRYSSAKPEEQMKGQHPPRILLLMVVILQILSACSRTKMANHLNEAELSQPPVTHRSAGTSQPATPFIRSTTSGAVVTLQTTAGSNPSPGKQPQTKTPSSSISSTPIPTWTPLSTLTPHQAQAFMLEMMKENAGCELPCFWGITPGETSWHDAEHSLAAFADSIIQGPVNNLMKDGIESPTTVYQFTFSHQDYSSPIRALFGVSNGIVEKIEVFPPSTELRYSLDQVLNRYGIPEEVLLDLLEDTNEGVPWFSFLLFYVEKGITVFYDGEAHINGEVFQACPTQTAPELILIPPGSQSLSKMEREALSGSYLPSIRQFPGMSTTWFYETLKEPGACLRIPSEDID
jgi:hypothetical protein